MFDLDSTFEISNPRT